MKVKTIYKEEYPFLLQKIEKPPESMELAGTVPDETNKFLCVIGSRNHSSYGKEVCSKLIKGLQGYPVVIVSGLAIGIDSIAHQEAINVGLKTIAFPGSGLADHVLYPASKRRLAHTIVESGGAVLSPFPFNFESKPWTFPIRNSLMAGSSHATLIIEAREESGTLITADATGEFSRDLLAVPGSIFSDLSNGANRLIRGGATAITSSEDVIEALGLTVQSTKALQTLSLLGSLTTDERKIVECLRGEILSSTDIIERTKLSPVIFNITVSSLELQGVVTQHEGRFRLT